jgi:hypothetical protein
MRLCGAVRNHYRRKQVEIAYPEHFAFNADQTAIRLVARYDIQAINPATNHRRHRLTPPRCCKTPAPGF